MVVNRGADGDFFSRSQSIFTQTACECACKNFWSVTLYETANWSGLDNGQPFPSLGSRDKPLVNGDGSIDLCFGPTPPNGKEVNWLRTVPGKGFFVILRLYGPTEASFDKSWKPGDLVKAK